VKRARESNIRLLSVGVPRLHHHHQCNVLSHMKASNLSCSFGLQHSNIAIRSIQFYTVDHVAQLSHNASRKSAFPASPASTTSSVSVHLVGTMMQFNDSFSMMNQTPIADPSMDGLSHYFIRPVHISSMRKGKTQLPVTFSPHPYSVILGRGKVNESVGNRRLKILVDIELNNYEKAPSRREKSFVVARVMETIQEACGTGAFIRCEGGLWYEVSDSDAREKISTMFRDKLSHQYKSSTSNKVERRRQRKAMKKTSTSERKPVSFVNMDFTRVQAELDSNLFQMDDSSSSSDSCSLSIFSF
jgi:hypothetical protein